MRKYLSSLIILSIILNCGIAVAAEAINETSSDSEPLPENFISVKTSNFDINPVEIEIDEPEDIIIPCEDEFSVIQETTDINIKNDTDICIRNIERIDLIIKEKKNVRIILSGSQIDTLTILNSNEIGIVGGTITNINVQKSENISFTKNIIYSTNQIETKLSSFIFDKNRCSVYFGNAIGVSVSYQFLMNKDWAICFDNVRYSSIYYNTLISNNIGIVDYMGTNNQIVSNSLYTNVVGVKLYDCVYTSVYDNYLMSTIEMGIHVLESLECYITYNTVNRITMGSGIVVENSDGTSISSSFTIDYNNVYYHYYWGIAVFAGDYITLEGNKAKYGPTGLYISNSNTIYVLENSVYQDNGIGIHVIGGSSINILATQVLMNDNEGILFEDVNGGIISQNDIYGNTYGYHGISNSNIYIGESPYIGNSIYSNTRGVFIEDGQNIQFWSNYIHDSETGIYISEGTEYIFGENSLIDNKKGIRIYQASDIIIGFQDPHYQTEYHNDYSIPSLSQWGGYGIYISGSSEIEIEYFDTSEPHQYGIYIFNSYEGVITDVDLEECWNCIHLKSIDASSYDFSLIMNEIHATNNGIYIEYSYGSASNAIYLLANDVYAYNYHTGNGIYFLYSDDNVVNSNDIYEFYTGIVEGHSSNLIIGNIYHDCVYDYSSY